MSTPDPFQQFLEAQREAYRRGLPEKAAQSAALWQAVQSSTDNAKALADLHRHAHTLAGTAGTLGFAQVGAAAAALEHLLAPPQYLTPEHVEAVGAAVAALQASLLQG
ncbi:MAG: Hpt domain-containing protein [Polaromonas sp.]|nr:Hpt domain-containing protein [Polaromonas sp.]